jgi:transcription antitermination factor NusG
MMIPPIGDRVRFISGPLIGIEGIVVATVGDRVRLQLSAGIYLELSKSESDVLVRTIDGPQ